jgi:hypothetical protein
VVGNGSAEDHNDAFYWSAERGLERLSTVLLSVGVDVTSGILSNATGISADGTVITGYGFGRGGVRPFVAEIPIGSLRFIPGDYNGNGQVEQADLDLVLLGWGDIGPKDGWNGWGIQASIAQDELDGVLLNWGTLAPEPSAPPVPEPSAVVLALIMSGLLACSLCA